MRFVGPRCQMGCLISRPRASNEQRASGTQGARVGHRKSGRRRKVDSELQSRGERDGNCDYATPKAHPEPGRKTSALISQPRAENINQTAAAQAPGASSKVIDLGQRDVGAGGELVLAGHEAPRMSRRLRKRQRQATGDARANGHDEASSQVAGSFLLMFVPGRRHSAMRIDAARESITSAVAAIEQPDEQLVSNAAFPINLNFLRPPNSGRETSGKRKSKASRQQPDLRASSSPVARAAMVQEAPTHLPIGGDHSLAVALSAQNSDPDAKPKSADDVILFTSLQQLCYEVFNRKLHRLLQEHEVSGSRTRLEAAACLFVFGRPGSSKGELAFDLVEHSSLVDLLGDREKLKRLLEEPEPTDDRCPVFHYIDVSGLIVANIDDRIRDYNKLVARTLRERRSQLALVATRQESEELDESVSDKHANDAEGAVLELRQEASLDSSMKQSGSLDDNCSSTGMPEAASERPRPKTKAAGQQQDARRASLEHQFGVMTLTTKQRSILQLKLMKYANCVTSKWVTILIKQEINKLERRLKQALAELGQLPTLLTRVPPRIYLINLVPNQLSIFKSCLYLEQDLSLGDFHRPHYAIKFERRTNIRVLRKERGVKREQQQDRKLSEPMKAFQFKLAHIKIPNLMSPSLSKSSSHESLITADASSRANVESAQSFATVSSELLSASNTSNEKLGPKYNETFAQQFKSCSRLLTVRFNPTTRRSAHTPAELPAQSEASVSCCLKLIQAQSCRTTPLPSPTPSSLVSSMLVRSESKRPNYQHSSSFEHLNLSPSTAGTEHSGSSCSSLIDLNRMDDANSVIGSALAGKTVAPKWAIELQLVCDGERLADKTDTTAESDSPDRKSSWQHPVALHTFQPPRSSSRSPLMFAAADRYQQLLSASSQQPSHESYVLVPTRVAYANGTNQTILEVKRIYKRSLKFKSPQDLPKLHKLVERLRRQLIEDLDSWLAAAIASEAEKLRKLNGDLQHELVGLLPSNKRQPSLVTQVICIDLSQFKKETGSGLNVNSAPQGANLLAPSSPTRTATRPVSALDRLRPSLKMRPASSMSNEESISDANAKQQLADRDRRRHVQFRLDPALDEQGERAPLGPVQRRLWINECLFASCSDVELLGCMHNFVELIH